MKTYSENELKELAEPVFEGNPTAEKLHATSDGEFFLENKLNAAQLHAKQKGGVKTPLRIYAISKAPVTKGAEKNIADYTVQEVKDLVAVINDVEKLKGILSQVDTKGGRAAVEARISELAAASRPADSPEKRGEKTEGEAPEGKTENQNEGK